MPQKDEEDMPKSVLVDRYGGRSRSISSATAPQPVEDEEEESPVPSEGQLQQGGHDTPYDATPEASEGEGVVPSAEHAPLCPPSLSTCVAMAVVMVGCALAYSSSHYEI